MTDRRTARPAAARPWRTVWLLSGLHGLAFADRFLIAPLALPLEHRLRLGDAGFGAAMGPALILPYAVAVLLCGRRLDTARALRWAPLSLLLCAFAEALGGLAGNSPLFLLSRGLLGMGEGGFDVAALLLLAGAPASGRGRALALFTSGSMVGKAVALSAGGFLLKAYGGVGISLPPAWRLVLLSFAVLTGAAGLIRLDTLGAFPGATPGQPGDVRPRSVEVAWRPLAFMIPMGAGVLLSQTLAAFAPLALSRRYGVAPTAVAELLGGVLLVLGLVGSQAGGELAVRLRRPGPPVLAAPLCAAAIGLLGLWASPTLAVALACVALMVLALSVLGPLGLDRLQRSTTAQEQGRVVGTYLSATTLIAFGLGPPSVGLLSERLHGPGGALAALCAILLLAATLGVAGALLLSRPRKFATQDT